MTKKIMLCQQRSNITIFLPIVSGNIDVEGAAGSIMQSHRSVEIKHINPRTVVV